jgi:hypothetical protein
MNLFNWIKELATKRNVQRDLERLKAMLGGDIHLYHSAVGSITQESFGTSRFADGQYTVRVGDPKEDPGEVANFSLTQLPGCCGVCVSHGGWLWIAHLHRPQEQHRSTQGA